MANYIKKMNKENVRRCIDIRGGILIYDGISTMVKV